MVTLLRWIAVIGAVFGAFVLAGWLGLVAWDRTHPPAIPDALKAPPAAKAKPGSA